VGDANSKPLKIFLSALATTITTNHLSQEPAYILLLSVTSGDTNFHIRQAMYEDNIPFEETWINLQKTSSRVPSIEGLQKELDGIFMAAPSEIEGALARIQTIRAKMFSNYPDEQMKKAFIIQSTTQDYINLIHTFYPSQAGRIEAAYDTRMEALQVEKELKERQGCLDTYRPPNEINILKELICSYLSRPFGITTGPSRLFGGTEMGSLFPPHKGKADIKAIEVSPSEESTAPATAGSAANSNSSLGGERRKYPNKAGYAKNPNVAATAYYGMPQPQQPPPPQMVPQYQQQQLQQPQAAPLMTMQALPAQQVPRPQAQGSYDPGLAQENYLNMGASIIPRVCFDTLGADRDVCFLCRGLGHWSSSCPLYPGEIPTTKQCQSCQGFHPTVCKGVGPTTNNGTIGLSRNFVPGQLSYGNGYVANNRYVNNRPQGNSYNDRERRNNYNNRPGGRPYNPNYDPNRGPRNPGQGGYRPRDDRRPYPQQPQQGYPRQQQQQMVPVQQVQQATLQPQQTYQGQQAQPVYQTPVQQMAPQQQMQNLTYQPIQQPKQGTLGNHGIQPTPEGVYMSVMQTHGQMQGQPMQVQPMQQGQPMQVQQVVQGQVMQGQVQLQHQQPQTLY
jgi:hypothetical protein